MPVMGLIAVDEPRKLARNDFIRLGLGTGASGENGMPYSESHVADFEQQYCDDRFWCDVGPSPNTRYLASGRSADRHRRRAIQIFSGQRTRRARRNSGISNSCCS